MLLIKHTIKHNTTQSLFKKLLYVLVCNFHYLFRYFMQPQFFNHCIANLKLFHFS
jgi:hypothetical protein